VIRPRPSRVSLAAAALALAWPAATLRAQAHPRRGPIEWREEWLLAQPRLTLPATRPDLLPPGRLQLRVDLDWGNDFGWRQNVAGESPDDRRFLVDGEHRSLSVGLRAGLTRRLEVEARLPVRWRGGGLMDGVIDWVHGLGFPDNGRGFFLRDQLRVRGRDESFLPLVWQGGSGTGLGNLELALRGALLRREASGWALSGVARAALPTGSGTFAGGGVEVGVQLVGAHPLGTAFDAYFGLGGTYYTDVELQGVAYARSRAHGFAALEWRPGGRWSLLLQLEAAGRLVEAVAEYPGFQSYLRIGALFEVSEGWTLEGGFSEGLSHQQATTDFGIGIGLRREF